MRAVHRRRSSVRRARRPSGIHLGSLHREGRDAVPYLRMSGRWLEQWGFHIGMRVYVSAERGRLILTSDPE
jgi:hypothetical protein